MTDTPPAPADDFIRRWDASGAAERANYALFLTELCDLLNVPRPEPTRPDDLENAYVFERSVSFHNADGSTSVGRIDLYKRGCFILEAKQGSKRPEAIGAGLSLPKPPKRKGTAVRGTVGWDDAMLAAKGQAEQYARALPTTEPNPPFLIVVDVGHTIELYTDFTRQGRTYTPFPDALSHRIKLRELADPKVRERIGLAWTDPLSLDPSRRSAKVTREVAARLAKLAQSLETSGHTPEAVAQFLMRCLFTFFAEDVGLLPEGGFTTLLKSLVERKETALFPDMVRSLWETMRTGGFSPILRAQLLRFNGGLFEKAETFPVTDEQIDLLIDAGIKQWRDVEPAIFGTLLERALHPVERHKLGAHYTPRAYVERLVMPTIIEPLRDDWANVQAAAVTLANEGKLPEARDEVRGFLRTLCNMTVLDPACGTGNFLYVTLEHMKRLEGEVLDALRGFGESQAAFEGFGLTVDPHQLRGIEINPRAAAIADLVLWIGFLQWHFRTKGKQMPAEPIIHAYHNIESRDAVFAYDSVHVKQDANNRPVTRWDRRTKKIHPVTGKKVPDESATMPVLQYKNPRHAEWPRADFIIGNPPYLGARVIKGELEEEYVEALRSAYSEVPESSDYVMYWWHKAALAVESGTTRRFGFITTSSITQDYSNKIVKHHLDKKNGIALTYAIATHPWVRESDGAAVDVAMSVGISVSKYTGHATLLTDVEYDGEKLTGTTSTVDRINYLLRPEGDHVEAALAANAKMCHQGVIPGNDGFKLSLHDIEGFGFTADNLPSIFKTYIIGDDIITHNFSNFIIDLYGLDEAEVRTNWPQIYQHLLATVHPERVHNNRESYRRLWWIFVEPRPRFRNAIKGLDRFIVTPYTAKFRPFMFVNASTIPDAMAYAISSRDAFHLGVLSSRAQAIYSKNIGGTLEDRPRYNSNRTFFPFPFPDITSSAVDKIRLLAERLDLHRKERLAGHPLLDVTCMYNVMQKLREGCALSSDELAVNEDGLVLSLKQIHDDLDAAVFDAYGWPRDLTDENILSRLVDLNRERAEEESRGIVRWLRPEFQNPEGANAARQGMLAIPTEAEPTPAEPAAPAKKHPWPKSLAEQAHAVRTALATRPAGLTADQLAKTFARGQSKRVADLLDTLVSLGQARELADGRYVRV